MTRLYRSIAGRLSALLTTAAFLALPVMPSAAEQGSAGPDGKPIGESKTGPWDLASLRKPPSFEIAGETDGLKKVYYQGEPYKGKPTRVFAYYGQPNGVKGKVPAMVLVHGGGGKAFPEWARLWAKRGYAALAMDLAGKGPDGKRLPDGGPDQDHVAKFQQMKLGLKNQWTYHAVAAVIRGASLLASRPEVDANRVGVTGISWGGYLTCIVAGLDDRLKVAVPVYGCGFLNDNSAWLGVLAQMPADERRAWLANFDPSRYLPNCRMPILFVNGTNDFAYPLDSYQKSYRLVRGKRTLCVTVNMPHSHPHGWAPKEIGIFVDHYLKNGPALPGFTRVLRRGDTIDAAFAGPERVVKAQLHTTPHRGPWNKRTWKSQSLPIKEDHVAAKLPKDRPLVWFLTITDQRGLTVSTEHEVVE